MTNFPEDVFLIQSAGTVRRNHFQNPLRLQPSVGIPRSLHFREKAERRIAREAVCPKTDVEAQVAQLLHRKRPVLKISAAARAMCDMKSRPAFEADEIFFREFVQMNHDPLIIDGLAFEHYCERRFS